MRLVLIRRLSPNPTNNMPLSSATKQMGGSGEGRSGVRRYPGRSTRRASGMMHVSCRKKYTRHHAEWSRVAQSFFRVTHKMSTTGWFKLSRGCGGQGGREPPTSLEAQDPCTGTPDARCVMIRCAKPHAFTCHNRCAPGKDGLEKSVPKGMRKEKSIPEGTRKLFSPAPRRRYHGFIPDRQECSLRWTRSLRRANLRAAD